MNEPLNQIDLYEHITHSQTGVVHNDTEGSAAPAEQLLPAEYYGKEYNEDCGNDGNQQSSDEEEISPLLRHLSQLVHELTDFLRLEIGSVIRSRVRGGTDIEHIIPVQIVLPAGEQIEKAVMVEIVRIHGGGTAFVVGSFHHSIEGGEVIKQVGEISFPLRNSRIIADGKRHSSAVISENPDLLLCEIPVLNQDGSG